MEESEKRRERLRVMRNEASEADGSPSFQSLPETGVLANPLVETPVVHDSHAMSRFDYYTDPMAAYSGNKRHNNSSQTSRDNSMSRGAGSGRGNPVMQYPPPPFGPGNPQMTPQPNYYANQGMQHGWRPPSYGSGPIRSPMPMFNPHPEHQHHGFPNQPGHYIPGNSSGGPPMPRPGYWAHSGPPSPDQGRGGTPFSNPGRGGSRGHWTNNSPSPGVSGYARGGRGVGNATSANLYRKSMVEDPWKDLNPVVWRAAVTSDLFRNPSSDAKKPRVEEACSVPKPKESLADYLAAAFNEAAEGGDAL